MRNTLVYLITFPIVVLVILTASILLLATFFEAWGLLDKVLGFGPMWG